MQAVNILSNLVLPPLLIGAYGSQVNGLVGTILQIISYISLVGAGLSVSTTQALYKPLAEDDRKTVSGMLSATGRMFNRVGSVFVVVAIALAFVYPFFIKSDLEYFYMVCLMLIMSISGAMEFFATGRYRSLLYADRKIYVYSLIQSACLLISTGLAVGCIKLGLNILYTQLMISLVYVLRAIGLMLYVRKTYAYVDKKAEPLNECVAKRKDAMYHQLIGLIVTGSQSILLSVFVGLEAASIYIVYNVVFSGLQSICVQMSNAVVPYLGRAYALNKDSLDKRYDSFELLFQGFISVIFATALVMIKPFIALYTEGTDINYIDQVLAIMFVVRGFASTYRLPAQGMINAAGYFAETKRAATIEAALCLSVELIMVQFIGIYGIMLGNIVALIWRGFEMILYTNKSIIIRKSFDSVMRVIKAAGCIAASFFITNAIIPTENIKNYFMWAAFACLAMLLSFVVVALGSFIVEGKKTMKSLKMIT